GFNLRALEYRLSQIEKDSAERGKPREEAMAKFGFEKIAVSVTLQQMIRSEKAGTAFSIDPASGLSNVISIDANYGYGESVVGGRVTPDNFLVSKDGKLIVRTLGKKDLMVRDRAGGGTEEVAVPAEMRGQWALSDAEI